MPLAPQNYQGYAVIRRPYYQYKGFWMQHRFADQPRMLHGLDPHDGEALWIETYQIEHSKDHYMTVYAYDINYPHKLEKHTYYYDAKQGLYSNIHVDEYIYFIKICNESNS